MARKSKRIPLLPGESPKQENIYQVGVYIRLSIEEKRDRKDSESIADQKEIIFDYLQDKADMKVYAVY